MVQNGPDAQKNLESPANSCHQFWVSPFCGVGESRALGLVLDFNKLVQAWAPQIRVGESRALRLMLDLKKTVGKNVFWGKFSVIYRGKPHFKVQFGAGTPKKFRVAGKVPPQLPRTPVSGTLNFADFVQFWTPDRPNSAKVMLVFANLHRQMARFGTPKWASENAAPYV